MQSIPFCTNFKLCGVRVLEYVNATLLTSTRLSLPRLCNLLSLDGRANERGRSARRLPFSFWRKAQSGERKKRRAGEKRSRWTKGSRLLISNVSDYVGLGSLRFFIQTKKWGGGGGEKRRGEERERQAAWLATTWLSNSSSVVVRFVLIRPFGSSSRFASCRSPLRGIVRFLLFYTVSYFALSEEQDGDDVDPLYLEERVRDHDSISNEIRTLVIVGPLIFAVGQVPCVIDRAFRMMDSSETVVRTYRVLLERVEASSSWFFFVGVNFSA